MSTRKSITPGDVFGRLTVLSEAPRRGYKRYWICQCSCGSSPKEIYHNHLAMLTKSCGCLRRETAAVTGKNRAVHDKSSTSEYQAWRCMWQRCTDPNGLQYLSYKDRAPPERWRDFRVFFKDMGPRPSLDCSIERVDNSKSYGPDNCVWATSKEQARNTKNNVNIEYQGRIQCIAAWAEEYGMKYSTLYDRLVARNLPIEKALNTKVGN